MSLARNAGAYRSSPSFRSQTEISMPLLSQTAVGLMPQTVSQICGDVVVQQDKIGDEDPSWHRLCGRSELMHATFVGTALSDGASYGLMLAELFAALLRRHLALAHGVEGEGLAARLR